MRERAEIRFLPRKGATALGFAGAEACGRKGASKMTTRITTAHNPRRRPPQHLGARASRGCKQSTLAAACQTLQSCGRCQENNLAYAPGRCSCRPPSIQIHCCYCCLAESGSPTLAPGKALWRALWPGVLPCSHQACLPVFPVFSHAFLPSCTHHTTPRLAPSRERSCWDKPCRWDKPAVFQPRMRKCAGKRKRKLLRRPGRNVLHG